MFPVFVGGSGIFQLFQFKILFFSLLFRGGLYVFSPVFMIGQHCYFWSDADMGDAYLLDTGDYDSVDEAILQLKREMLNLFQAFSVI